MSPTDVLMRQFRDIVLDRIGLVLPAYEDALIEHLLQERPQQRQLDTASYLSLLQSRTVVAEEEWRQLILDLTTGESYFFRDGGQMTLLREVLLPELIQRKKDSKTLRIWSAGCSTGEEPYSIAMLLDQLLPDRHGWHIVLIGSDINEQALEKARRGCYGAWSFRRMERVFMERYFVPDPPAEHAVHWRLTEPIRQMVTFRRLNLVHDLFPSELHDLHAMDMIVCRNVFIYFTSSTILNLAEKFTKTLSPGGILITGHAEMHGVVRPAELALRLFTASAIYQRLERPAVATTPSHQPPATVTPVVGPPPSRATPSRANNRHRQPALTVQPSGDGGTDVLAQAQQLFTTGRYQELIQLLEQYPAKKKSAQHYYWSARAHANSGHLAQAERDGHRALAMEPLSAPYHTLLAHIFHGQSRSVKTVETLKKALYLDGSYIPAYLALAELYRNEGDVQRSRRTYSSALELMAQLADTAQIEYHEEWRVRELQQQIEQLLANS
ncbi:MAG: hypothetical protein HQL60_06580 [Magnetococcales bacterium]|nr:hypothetical protein [Magnetococcales bacterium]